jgi:hypothetical protein
MRRVPPTAHPPGGRPLDPDRPASDDARASAADGTPGGPGAESTSRADDVPGLRAQIGATRDALIGLVRAHVELARAEAGEIGGEITRAAALSGVAVGLVILLAIFLPIGLMLFLGEWWFGSIGWGVLMGSELLISLAVALVLVTLRVPGLAFDFIGALVVGVLVAVLVGAGVLHELWRQLGDAISIGDPAWRPLLVGVIVLGIVGGLVGALIGGRIAGGRGALGAFIAFAVLGGLIGAVSAITFEIRAGIGLGVATGLLVWPILMGWRVARQGIDTEALKARFWPQATIDTTKETIEWARSRTPLGRGS